MKKILVLVFAAIIIAKSPTQELPICNLQIVKLAFTPIIFEQTTIDGLAQPVLLTRFLHNKVGIYSSEIARCYLAALDPNFINNSTSIVGLLSLLFFLYKAASKIYSQKSFAYAPLLAIFLISPLLPFFSAPTTVLIITYKIFAIIGLLFWLKRR